MTETTEKKIAKPQRIMTSARVICEPNYTVTYYYRTEEKRAEALDRWVKEFNQFIRDHRHQDGTYLHVERVHEEVCSECGAKWEVMPADQEGPEACAYCGTPTK